MSAAVPSDEAIKAMVTGLPLPGGHVLAKRFLEVKNGALRCKDCRQFTCAITMEKGIPKAPGRCGCRPAPSRPASRPAPSVSSCFITEKESVVTSRVTYESIDDERIIEKYDKQELTERQTIRKGVKRRTEDQVRDTRYRSAVSWNALTPEKRAEMSEVCADAPSIQRILAKSDDQIMCARQKSWRRNKDLQKAIANVLQHCPHILGGCDCIPSRLHPAMQAEFAEQIKEDKKAEALIAEKTGAHIQKEMARLVKEKARPDSDGEPELNRLDLSASDQD